MHIRLFIILTVLFVGLTTAPAYAFQKPEIIKSPLASSQLPIQRDYAADPQYIEIPRLRVRALIESVGLDKDKRMEVPQQIDNVGWYRFGPKPGQIGNAVIDGHVDKTDGSPSVFYNLALLKEGDTIEVVDSDNVVYIFIVTQVSSYPVSLVPLQKIFEQSETSHLNLITCGGVYNKKKQDYLERTVVYSTLKRIKLNIADI